MASTFYDHTTVPATGSALSSSSIRSEFDSIEAGFDKLLDPSGQANKVVKVNAAGTGYTASIITDSGTAVTVSGDLSATGVNLATALKSATTSVSVSAATAPSSGQVLTATSSTTATWQSVAANFSITNKAANYTVVAADRGKMFRVQGAYTMTLDDATTLGADWYCEIANATATDTSVVTVNPGAYPMNGTVNSIYLSPGQCIKIACDGARFFIISTSSVPYAPSEKERGLVLGSATAIGTRSIGIAPWDTSSNIVSGTNAIGIGYVVIASATGAVAIGNAEASASGAIAIGNGGSSTASGSNAIAIGYGTASGAKAVVIGNGGKAEEIGKSAHANGTFSALGDIQRGGIQLRARSTTNALVVLTSDGAAATTNNQLVAATDKAMTFTGRIIGKQKTSANIAAYTITGTLVNNGGTVTMPTGTVTAVGAESITLDAAPTLAADNTNKCLTVNSGYKTGTDIRWACDIEAIEVVYA